MTALPDWARQMQPVDMAGCALVLGISRRTLVDVLKKHPHYERRGTKKVFYPQHVDALREALACPISSSNRAKASGTPLALLPESAFDKAWALATKREPKSLKRSSKHGNGNVIPMATLLQQSRGFWLSGVEVVGVSDRISKLAAAWKADTQRSKMVRSGRKPYLGGSSLYNAPRLGRERG